MNVAGRHGPGILLGVIAGLMLLSVAAAARVDLRLFGGRQSLRAATRTLLGEVERAAEHFGSDNGECPSSLEMLYAQHYLVGAPRDAWSHPIKFSCPGAHNADGVDVSSAGPDGLFDTADDLTSWER